jgi:hypothetical protein
VIGSALFRIVPITRRNCFRSTTIGFAAFSRTSYTIADLCPHRHLTELQEYRHPSENTYGRYAAEIRAAIGRR